MQEATERELTRLLELIERRCQAWSSRAWRSPAGSAGTRADAIFAAVGKLADLAAEAERRPRQAVPRLEDPALSDQLAVMVHDLLATGDPAAVYPGISTLAELAAQVGIRA